MALVIRFVVIVVAIVLASIVAGMAAAAGLIGSVLHTTRGGPVEDFTYWSAVSIASAYGLAITFLPLVVAIVLAEAFSLRAFLIYAAGGAVLMLIGYYASGTPGLYEESIDQLPPLIPRGAEVAAATGVAFGTVYWMIAGRRAGAWRRPA